MQTKTLSRLAQPKRRHQPLQACGSPTRARALSPRSSAGAQQVILKQSDEEVEVAVDGKVFLVDLESRLVFQILPEITSDEEIGTWDRKRQLIIFRQPIRSPSERQQKAEPGNGIVERLMQYQAEKERRLEEKRLKEQQKRLAEELAECRPSPRILSGTSSSSTEVDGVAVAERCQAWAEKRDAKLEAARQRQRHRHKEADLRCEPEPERGPGA